MATSYKNKMNALRCIETIQALTNTVQQWFLTRGEFPTRGEFEKLKGGILILHSENLKHCVLSCSTIRVANFQTLVWDLRLFVILQTSLLLFHIYWKPRLFCISHHKTTSKHPKTQKFRLFCKNFLWTWERLEKTGKASPLSWFLLCLGRPLVSGNAYVKHFAKFLDFFETQCWQLWEL